MKTEFTTLRPITDTDTPVGKMIKLARYQDPVTGIVYTKHGEMWVEDTYPDLAPIVLLHG